MIVDAAGYFPGEDAFKALPAPARLLDTRPGQSTIDGAFNGEGVRPTASVQVLQVSGRANIPADVSTIVLNVTVDQPQVGGYVTVYPCDAGVSDASNVNYVAAQAVPNAVISKLSAAGTVCLFTSGATQMIVDVAGYFADATVLVPLGAPAGLLDTRPTGATIDGSFSRTGLRPAGGTIQLSVSGRANIPLDASSVVLDVTVDQPQAAGFITSTQPESVNRTRRTSTTSRLKRCRTRSSPDSAAVALCAYSVRARPT